MNDKDQLWKLKRYYEKVLIDYYSTDEIDPDMANRIVGGLTRFMNITEQQQQEIERLKADIEEALELLKRGGPGTRSQIQQLLEKALEGEE